MILIKVVNRKIPIEMSRQGAREKRFKDIMSTWKKGPKERYGGWSYELRGQHRNAIFP